MEKSITCPCGNTHFWFLGRVVRCTECYAELRYYETHLDPPELWARYFDKDENQYRAWERIEV